MESSDTHFDALENNLLAETPPSDQPPFEILKIVLWVIIAILCLLYLYSFILMLRLFKILKFYTQKVLIQTILYINLSLLFRIGYFLCFELYFYDQSITPWKHSWYLTLILGTNAFTVLSFLFIFFQWLAFKIVSEIQISGNYHEYKPRIRTKNFFLSVSTGFILILSLCLMSVMLVVDDKYSGQIESAMRLFLTVIIFFTVIALSMVCVKLLATLELHYRNFYLQNRGFILGMTLALIASSIVRVGNILWKQKVGNAFYTYIYEDGMTNGWFMPTYFGLHFFLVDFLSSGALLLNFGFTIQNKKQVVQVETQDRWGQKLMQRRETFLNIEDSDEDEEEGGSGVYVDTQTNENPFQLKAKLGGKLDSSPISSPHSNGGDSPDFGGRFNRFFRGLTKQNRASSKRKRQLTESQKVPGPTIVRLFAFLTLLHLVMNILAHPIVYIHLLCYIIIPAPPCVYPCSSTWNLIIYSCSSRLAICSLCCCISCSLLLTCAALYALDCPPLLPVITSVSQSSVKCFAFAKPAVRSTYSSAMEILRLNCASIFLTSSTVTMRPSVLMDLKKNFMQAVSCMQFFFFISSWQPRIQAGVNTE